MSITRNNHYVPQWYQAGFLEPDQNKLAYLDMKPQQYDLADGTTRQGRTRYNWTTTQCFRKYDLYSTFFGFEVDDEIERRLFGAIDGMGKPALGAFVANDLEGWIEHFESFFEVMDAQKLRTPKGLAWLQKHYPPLDQNELMREMQGIRMMNCTLWSECVRELVSAEDADVKFIVSDHPVTVYNHAVPPWDPACEFPEDPLISQKATQTIFPLDRDHCLILTNLEYAQDPDLAAPLRKRTNARNFGSTIFNADAFIRSRKLTNVEVTRINHVVKARANQFIAGGRHEWLHPEDQVDADWAGIRRTLLPPAGELFGFGGEIFIGYDDGRVDYRDEFGRSEKRAPFLDRAEDDRPSGPKDFCGCGSSKRFVNCCQKIPADLRPSWSELSIRERNIMHANAICAITGLRDHGSWKKSREELSDEKIARIYRAFRGLWPLDTDLVSLLPKPDGRLRSLFTGLVDPRMVTEFALGSSNFFGEVLMQNPFTHSGCVKPKANPEENPAAFRQQVLKDVSLLLDMMPLIDAGIVNLFPNPCFFDHHLRREMWQMATERTEHLPKPVADVRSRWPAEDDYQRSFLATSEDTQRHMLRKAQPDLSDEHLEKMIEAIRIDREADPLSPLRLEGGSVIPEGGLLMLTHMSPNLELSLFLAQSTGSIIVTDSPHRWRELQDMARRREGAPMQLFDELRAELQREPHEFLGSQEAIEKAHSSKASEGYRSLIHDVAKFLRADSPGPKPNWASQLKGRAERARAAMTREVGKRDSPSLPATVRCIIPSGGIRDNTVARLLLMSSVEVHADSVPMAIFIQRPNPLTYPRPHTRMLQR